MNDDEYDPRRVSAEDLPVRSEPPAEARLWSDEDGEWHVLSSAPGIDPFAYHSCVRYVLAPEGSAVISPEKVARLLAAVEDDDWEYARERALDVILRAARDGAS